jgi:hypothetical protein
MTNRENDILTKQFKLEYDDGGWDERRMMGDPVMLRCSF